MNDNIFLNVRESFLLRNLLKVYISKYRGIPKTDKKRAKVLLDKLNNIDWSK